MQFFANSLNSLIITNVAISAALVLVAFTLIKRMYDKASSEC